jgi:uncharacterized protein YdeI (YjbR/CyaY-like superfamily)
LKPDIAKPTSFRTGAAFRAWLRRHHRNRSELLVRLFKVHAADQGMTYAQALDEALCFGWIDGVRRSLDADSFTIRFSPRQSRSIWSRVNVAHVRRLIRDGRMEAPGLAAFRARSAARTGVYAFERAAIRLAPELRRRLDADAAAAAYFDAEAPYYRHIVTHWVMSAKREETRLRRLQILIDCSRRKTRIPPLRRT